MSIVDSSRSIHCIKGEIYNILSLLRLESNWESNSRFYREVPLENDTPLTKMFKSLNEELSNYDTIRELDPMVYLAPFLILIRTPYTSAIVTGAAISSIHKFLLYGFISLHTKNVMTVINELACTVSLCRFESTYTTTEESLFLKILDLILILIRNDAGIFLTHDSVMNLLNTCYKMATIPSSNPLLQLTAENTLAHFILSLFSHLQNISEGKYDDLYKACGQTISSPECDITSLHSNISSEEVDEVTPISDTNSHGNESENNKNTLAIELEIKQSINQHKEHFTEDTLQSVFDFVADLTASQKPQYTRLLGFTLINIIIEMGGEAINKYNSLIKIIQNKVCKNIIINSETDDLSSLSLCLRLIYNLFQTVKDNLKLQLEVFFVSIYIRHLSSTSSSPSQKELVLESLVDFFREPSLVLDIYTNYDCDVQCTNLFEKIFTCLAENSIPETTIASSAISPSLNITSIFTSLNSLSMQVILAMLHSISSRCTRRGNTPTTNFSEDEWVLESKQKKHIFNKFSTLFNNKQYKEATDYALSMSLLTNAEDAKGMAKLIYDCPSIDKTILGDYIAYDKERKPFNAQVRYYFVRQFSYEGLSVDDILRVFLGAFKIPGEAQAIDRILDDLSSYVYLQSPGPFLSSDALFSLLFSCLLLNTDLHNPGVKNKMTLEDFVQNNRGINEHKDLPLDYLTTLYKNIRDREIILYESDLESVNIERWEEALQNKEGRINEGRFTHDENRLAGSCEREMFKLINKQCLDLFFNILNQTEDTLLINKIITGMYDYANISNYYQLDDCYYALYDRLYTSIKPLMKDIYTRGNSTNNLSPLERNKKPYTNHLSIYVLKAYFNLILKNYDNMKGHWNSLFDLCSYLNLYSFISPSPATSLDIPSPTKQVLPTSIHSLSLSLTINTHNSIYINKTFVSSSSLFVALSSLFKSDSATYPSEYITEIQHTLGVIDIPSLFYKSEKLFFDSFKELVECICTFPDNDIFYISSYLESAPVSSLYKYLSLTYIYRLELLYILITKNSQRLSECWNTIYTFLDIILKEAEEANLHYVLERYLVYIFYIIKKLLESRIQRDHILSLLKYVSYIPDSIYISSRRISGLYLLLDNSIVSFTPDFWSLYIHILSLDIYKEENKGMIWLVLCRLLEQKYISIYNYSMINQFALSALTKDNPKWTKPVIDYLFALLVYSTHISTRKRCLSPLPPSLSSSTSSSPVTSASSTPTNRSSLHRTNSNISIDTPNNNSVNTPNGIATIPVENYVVITEDQCWLMGVSSLLMFIEDPSSTLEIIQYVFAKLSIAFSQLMSTPIPSDAALYECFQNMMYHLLCLPNTAPFNTNPKSISVLLSFFSKCFLICIHRLVRQNTFHAYWLKVVTQFTRYSLIEGEIGEMTLEIFKNMIMVMKSDNCFEEASLSTGQNVLLLTWSIVDSISPCIRQQCEYEEIPKNIIEDNNDNSNNNNDNSNNNNDNSNNNNNSDINNNNSDITNTTGIQTITTNSNINDNSNINNTNSNDKSNNNNNDISSINNISDNSNDNNSNNNTIISSASRDITPENTIYPQISSVTSIPPSSPPSSPSLTISTNTTLIPS
ncbi:hypothetical protein WA158_002138 [Blastocystis sp. Blastoise]